MKSKENVTKDDFLNKIISPPEEEQPEEEEENGFTVFNSTDGFFATPIAFKSIELAVAWIVEFRNQYRRQGYYSTSDRTRISPDEIELDILPPNFQF